MKNFKNIGYVTGPKSLLEAFAKELEKNDYTRLSNVDTPQDHIRFENGHYIHVPSLFKPEWQFTLPDQWHEALAYALEEEGPKEGEYWWVEKYKRDANWVRYEAFIPNVGWKVKEYSPRDNKWLTVSAYRGTPEIKMTPSEIETELDRIRKELGYVYGAKFIGMETGDEYKIGESSACYEQCTAYYEQCTAHYEHYNDRFYIDGIRVYEKGQWAEIVEPAGCNKGSFKNLIGRLNEQGFWECSTDDTTRQDRIESIEDRLTRIENHLFGNNQ